MDLIQIKAVAEHWAANDPDGFAHFCDVLAESSPDDILDLIRLAELGKPLADRGITLPPLDDVSDYMILAVRKGTLTTNAQQALQRVVVAISNNEPLTIARGHFAVNILDLVQEKFRSGNDIPVERITLTREEVGL